MNDTETKATPKRTCRSKILRLSTASLLVLLTIILAATLSTTGLKIALSILKKNIPGQLTYTMVSGKLLGPITFSNLTYTSKDNIFTAKKIYFDWQKLALLTLHLKINTLRIEDSTLTTSSSYKKLLQFNSNNNTTAKVEEKQKTEWKPVWLHTRMHIQDITIKNLKLYNKNSQQTWGLQRLHGRINIDKNNVYSRLSIAANFPRASTMDLKTHGKPNNYTIALKSTGEHTKFNISGNGDMHHLKLHTVQTKLWGGTLSGSTEMSWSPTLLWKLNWTAHNIDPARVWANKKTLIRLPSKLSGEIVANGDSKKSNISWRKIKVKLDKHILNTFGSLVFTDSKVTKINVRMYSRDGNIKLNGTYDNLWRLQWNIRLHNLSIFSDYLTGKLSAKGMLRGSRKEPQLIGNLQARHVSWNDVGFQNVSTYWNIHTGNKKPISMSTKLTGAFTKKQAVQNMQLNLYGTLAEHKLVISGNTPNSRWAMAVNGKQSKQEWQGSLNQWNIDDRVAKTSWKLKQPVAMSYSAKGFNIDSLELLNKSSYLQLSANWKDANNSKINLKVKSWPLHNFQPWMPPLIKMGGRMSGHSKITISNGKFKEWSNHFTLGSGIWKIQPKQIWDPLLLHVNYAVIDSSISNSTLNLQIKGGLNNTSRWYSTISLPNYNSLHMPLPSQKIIGNLQVHSVKIHTLEAIIPGTDKLRGTVSANAKITGSWAQPLLHGKVELKHGAVTLTHYGISLNKAHASIIANGAKASFNLIAYTEGRPLHLTGEMYFSSQNFLLNARLTGNDALIWDDDSYTFYATPDLKFKMKNKYIYIYGNVDLPRGSIHPKSFSSVQYLSEDTIILKNKDQDKGFSFDSDIKLIPGERLQIDASGISGDITGNIKVKSGTDKVTVANGRLSLKQGTYRIQGKTLNLKRGQLIFRRSPLDSPFLNITASRTINPSNDSMSTRLRGKLTVGLTIAGTLRQPIINFFSSESDLTQSEIISYLAFGQQTASTLTLATDALTSLTTRGDSGGPGLADEIQQGLDLNEFGIEQRQQNDPLNIPITQQQESFVVGKKIGNNFNIRYLRSTSQINSTNQIQLNYNINMRWSIQTELSQDGTDNKRRDYGADLFYTIEKN